MPYPPHSLYELCVQRPDILVPWLESLHGHSPKVLHEDFCGTASICRTWAARDDNRIAVGLDLDPETIDRAKAEASHLPPALAARIHLHRGDALDAPQLLIEEPRADVTFVGNFSIGEIHTREGLVQYLRGARARLSPSGIFACDTYGGAAAWRTGHVTRTFIAADGAIVRYTWEQRSADPFTACVVNALHFSVERAGEIVLQLPDAFVYHWRLWSFAELRDALHECGYSHIEITGAIDNELAPTTPNPANPTPSAAPDEGLQIACMVAHV